MSLRNLMTEEPPALLERDETRASASGNTSPSRSKRVLLAAIGAIAIMAAVYFLFIREHKPAATAPASADPATAAAVPVSTVLAVAAEIPSTLQASGSFSPFESTDVAPQTPGQIIATPVDEGDFVKKGETLVRLDDRDARLRVQQAKAAVTQMEAAVNQARSSLGLSGAEQLDPERVAEVQSAKAELTLAEANERRYRNLLETGDVPQAQYDEYKARLDTARKAYESAVARARSGGAGIDVQLSALASARAQLAIAEKALADTVVTAPLSGYVQSRKSAVGEWVTTSSVVATLVQSDALKLVLQISESDSASVTLGQDVTVWVDAFPDREFKGTMAALLPALDPNSRALFAVVGVRNPDGALKPGMFATARIALKESPKTGILVPKEAVMKAPSGTNLVYVVRDGHAIATVVQVGADVDGNFLLRHCDGTVRLWDTRTGAEPRSLKLGAGPLTALDFSADGRRIYVGAVDGSIRVWTVATSGN